MKQNKKPSHKILEHELENAIIKLTERIGKACKDKFNPEDWVKRHKNLIQESATAPIEECVARLIIVVNTICFIFKTDNPWEAWIVADSDIDKAGSIPDWRILLDLAEGENYEEIKELCTTSGDLTVRLGYSILFLLPAIRIDRCLEINTPTNRVRRDSFYVRCIEILEKYPKGRPYLEKAFRNLSQNALNIIGTQTIDHHNIWSFVPKPVMEAYPSSYEESLNKALKGDISIDYIPNAIARDLEKKPNELRIKEQLILDSPIAEGSDEDSRTTFIEIVPDVNKLSDVEKVSDRAKWLETLKDPQDREIAILAIKDPDITIRKIADTLSLSKSDVGRRIKKLKLHL